MYTQSWWFIGATAFNVVASLPSDIINFVVKMFSYCLEKAKTKTRQFSVIPKNRRVHRKNFTEIMPGEFKNVEEEMNVHEAIKFCK